MCTKHMCSLLWRKPFEVKDVWRSVWRGWWGGSSFLSHLGYSHGHLADIFLYTCLQAATRVFVCTNASHMTGCAHSRLNSHSFVRLNRSWWPASVNMCIQRMCDGKLDMNRAGEQKCLSSMVLFGKYQCLLGKQFSASSHKYNDCI